MKKLDKNIVQYLQKLIKTCSLCGIDSVAIEKDIVRGASTDSNRGIFLIEKDNIPALPFSSLGIGRVKIFGARMGILSNDKLNVEFDGVEKDNGDTFVKRLQLSDGKTKAEFSCFDVMKIKAPRAFKDDFVYNFTINEDTLHIMPKAVSAIETSKISFSSEKDGTVRFLTTDSVGDTFDHVISDDYIMAASANKPNFYFSYEIKYVLPLLKAALDETGSISIDISNRGILRVKVNGFGIHVLPEVE